INPGQAIEDLATNLSGAQVRIDRGGDGFQGTLVGLHQEEEGTGGEPIHAKSVVVLTADGLKRCSLRDIECFQFLDADVQQEIDKALQRNYQRIKPNSTFVEMVLSAEADTEAIVQYTLPAAAWKISYRLQIEEGKPTALQGYAVVDNNTDEDWTDFRVCVVTGEPITFSTDLAESKTPRRSHVQLVNDEALGAVEVDADILMGGAAAEAEAPAGGGMRMAKRAAAGMSRSRGLSAAKMAAAEVHEVGDFSIFEADSLVTIPAKRSTVIPVFSVTVDETNSVLHYKHENHAERPYRSVDFANQTDFSLGRGVCTVFEKAAYAGSCVIPALKPTESRLLPHALENSVSVHRDQKRQRSKVVALRLAEGFCYTSTRQRRETHYHIKNNKDAAYKLVLDHDHTLSEPTIDATVVQGGEVQPLERSSKLVGGSRYTLSLPPKSALVVKVVELSIQESKVQLVRSAKTVEDAQIIWLQENIIKTNGPLALDEGVLDCLRIHTEVEAKRQEIQEAVRETERLAGRQDRLRKNIKSGGKDDLSQRWLTELDEAERAIQKIDEEQIPTLRREEKALTAQLAKALKSLSAEWSET
ncbi:MAG: DUF4139 domain-containing protein, partial [Pirellulaceae bacterium]|nr:DUF4139 domain-containing protein [Pirellulaceae bacterium]